MRFPWEFEKPSCAEVGTILFFSVDQDDPSFKNGSDTYEDARKVCNSCVHRIECAEYGIKYETHGMWGGLSPRERKSMRRQMRITMPDKPSISM